MFLAGEYAVTMGAPALIAAVPPWGRASGSPDSGMRPLFPGAPTQSGGMTIDTSAFFQGKTKLGFGSSATAAVLQAAAGATDWQPDRLWLRAMAEHERMTGGKGSGGDLAAVIHGGLGIFRRQQDMFRWTPLRFPDHASLLVVATGQSANTREWLGRFRAAAERDAAWQDWLAASSACVDSFADPKTDWLSAMTQAAACYAELRRWLGEALYPPVFQTCLAIGRRLTLPFKPSGAGGGDIGFFYCPDALTNARLQAELSVAGLVGRTLRPTQTGLHRL